MLGKNVLIIGGAGFIGSNLAIKLYDNGYKVTILDRNVHKKKHFKEFILDRNIELVEFDIENKNKYLSYFESNDLVYNFAGINSNMDSIMNPINNLKANCEFHLKLLEICKDLQSDIRIIYASSRLVYGSQTGIKTSEKDITKPKDLYGIHKLCSENYYRIYAEIYENINYNIVRITNPYGPEPLHLIQDRKYNFINNLISKVLKNEEITIFGDGSQIRDYIFVDDLVEALFIVGNGSSINETFNVGSGQGVSILETIIEIGKILEINPIIKFVEWPELYYKIETGDFIADISSIEKKLNWSPKTNLFDGISKTIKYFEEL